MDIILRGRLKLVGIICIRIIMDIIIIWKSQKIESNKVNRKLLNWLRLNSNWESLKALRILKSDKLIK